MFSLRIASWGVLVSLLAPLCWPQQKGTSAGANDFAQPLGDFPGVLLIREQFFVVNECTYVEYFFSNGSHVIALDDCDGEVFTTNKLFEGFDSFPGPRPAVRASAVSGRTESVGSEAVTLGTLQNGSLLVAYTSKTMLTTAVMTPTADALQTTGQYPVGPTAQHVVAADFNGDGNLDLAVSNFGNSDNSGGNVAIFLGKGDGTFTPGAVLNAGQTPVSMYAADFNGDGKVDLAVANLTTGSLSVLLGNGDGTFQRPTTYTFSGTTSVCPANIPCDLSSVIAADVNRDGSLDLAVLLQNANVLILLGNGDGTFQAPVSYPGGSGSGTYLASMDLNGDGKPDLIVAGQFTDTISLLFGNGDGSFQAPVEYVAGDMPGYFVLLPTATGAVIATVDYVTGFVVGMAVLPNGVAAAPQVHPLTGPVTGVAAGDLNGDGLPDIVAANGAVSVLIRKPGSEFAPVVSYSLKSGSQAVAVTLTDLNGDGRNDVIAASSTSSDGGTVDVLLGNGNGTLGNQASYPIGGYPGDLTFGASGIVTGDFNGDGKRDVAAGFQFPASGSGASGVSVLLGNGDGTLRPAVNYPLGLAVLGMATGDFNGDGKLDIATAQGGANSNYSTPGALQILFGTGDGTFKSGAPMQVGSPPKTPVSLAAADLNADGKLDLVAVVQDANYKASIVILLGNGDGTFRQLPAITSIEYQDTAIAIADVNADGIPDLIVAASESAYLLGNGDGTFTAPVYFSSGPDPTAFAVTDWNNESVAGLAVATEGAVMAIRSGLNPKLSGMQITSVENAEGGAPAIAPNTWVEIDGAGLAPVGDTRIWAASDFVNSRLPTQLDGVSVTVNGKPAYVYYISPTQVNILTPPDALGSGEVQVIVTNNGSVSAAIQAQAQPISPSLFMYGGTSYVAAVHADGSLIGPASLYPGSSTPAKPGETVQLYANGFGPTNQAVVSGSESQGGSFSPPPAVTIGGVAAAVTFAGLVSPGLYQINVTVPASLADGDQPVIATYNGSSTQSGVAMAVHR